MSSILAFIVPLFVVLLLILFVLRSHSAVKKVNAEIYGIIGVLLVVLGILAKSVVIAIVGGIYILYGAVVFFKNR